MQSAARELEFIKVGAPTHFGGLTIFPLFRNGSTPVQPGYMLLEEAVVRGGTEHSQIVARLLCIPSARSRITTRVAESSIGPVAIVCTGADAGKRSPRQQV
jgi:hypothetical protein